MMKPRLIGGLTLLDDGSWSGTLSDDGTVQTGMFTSTDCCRMEGTFSWLIWNPFNTRPVMESSDP